jgi:hypothetical protein
MVLGNIPPSEYALWAVKFDSVKATVFEGFSSKVRAFI